MYWSSENTSLPDSIESQANHKEKNKFKTDFRRDGIAALFKKKCAKICLRLQKFFCVYKNSFAFTKILLRLQKALCVYKNPYAFTKKIFAHFFLKSAA
jgi:hypothetical protein